MFIVLIGGKQKEMQTVFLTILVIKSKGFTMAHQALQDLAQLAALITKLLPGSVLPEPWGQDSHLRTLAFAIPRLPLWDICRSHSGRT